MTRAWSVVVAAGSALCLPGTYLVTFVPMVERVVRATRDPLGYPELADQPAVVVARACAFFVARSGREPLEAALRGLTWLPVLVMFVLVAVLTYLAARNTVAGAAHAAALGAGAVLLAAAAGDAAGLLIAMIRYDPPQEYVGSDSETKEVIFRVARTWDSEAIFLGLLIAVAVALSLVVQRFAWRMTKIAFQPREVTSRIRDVPGQANNLALFGLLPIAALAFLGGMDRFVSPENEQAYSLPNTLAEIALYPRVRPTAPPDREVGFEATLALEQWLPHTILGLVFLGVLWLLLRWVASGLPQPEGSGIPALLVIWGTVVLAGALLAFADSAVMALLAGDSPAKPLDRQFTSRLLENLPLGMRFGLAWGWLVGLIMLVAHRRSAVADKNS